MPIENDPVEAPRVAPRVTAEDVKDILASLRASMDGESGIPPGEQSLAGAHLAGANLSGLDLSNWDLTGAELSHANLAGARLTGADLQGARLYEADLTGAELLGANLADADLTNCEAARCGFGAADLSRASLCGASLTGATLSCARLEGADLRKADLSGARLQDASARGANFSRALLVRADLRRADVSEAIFVEAGLREVRLRGLKGYETADWIGVDTINANFTGAYLVRRTLADQNYLHEFRTQNRAMAALYWVWWLTSDCGRSFVRWGMWTALIAVLFAGMFEWTALDYGDHPTPLSTLYFSCVTLTTLGYGEVVPASMTAQVLAIVEVSIGYVLLGGLLSIFANKMARRAD